MTRPQNRPAEPPPAPDGLAVASIVLASISLFITCLSIAVITYFYYTVRGPLMNDEANYSYQRVRAPPPRPPPYNLPQQRLESDVDLPLGDDSE